MKNIILIILISTISISSNAAQFMKVKPKLLDSTFLKRIARPVAYLASGAEEFNYSEMELEFVKMRIEKQESRTKAIKKYLWSSKGGERLHSLKLRKVTNYDYRVVYDIFLDEFADEDITQEYANKIDTFSELLIKVDRSSKAIQLYEFVYSGEAQYSTGFSGHGHIIFNHASKEMIVINKVSFE